MCCGNHCAPKKTKNFATDCVSTGQEITFIGRFLLPPIPLAIDDAFSIEEAIAIQRAAFTWNDFFTVVQGGNIFDIGPLGSPRRGVPPVYNPDGLSCGVGVAGFVNGSWGDRVLFAAKRSAISGGIGALQSKVLALTTSCPIAPIGTFAALTQIAPYLQFSLQNFEQFPHAEKTVLW